MLGRLHKARALALFRGATHMLVRVQTNIGFAAKYATVDLLSTTVKVKGRKKAITIDDLAARLIALKPIDFGYGVSPARAPRIEFRDGDGN